PLTALSAGCVAGCSIAGRCLAGCCLAGWCIAACAGRCVARYVGTRGFVARCALALAPIAAAVAPLAPLAALGFLRRATLWARLIGSATATAHTRAVAVASSTPTASPPAGLTGRAGCGIATGARWTRGIRCVRCVRCVAAVVGPIVGAVVVGAVVAVGL